MIFPYQSIFKYEFDIDEHVSVLSTKIRDLLITSIRDDDRLLIIIFF